MKRAARIICGLALAAVSTLAEPPAGAGPKSNTTSQAGLTASQSKAVLQALGAPQAAPRRPVTYGGVLGRAAQGKKPWQQFNPLRPARPGDPPEDLARDPVTGKPQGITFLSIKF